MSVILQTNLGNITIDLYVKERPNTSRNFLKLCKLKYYNNCLFHNIQSDFLVQTGDPTNTGKGGTSLNGLLYGEQAQYFNDEMKPPLSHKYKGTVAMASKGENLNASQFYITTVDGLTELDEKHTIFGRVAEGFDALARINNAYCDDDGRPFQNIRIHHVYVLDDPFADPPGLEVPPSPDFKPDEDRLEADQPILEEGRTQDEIDEEIAAKEAHSRQEVLEMIGDIPDADIRPPDNVLFICKLNPVTRDEDLHLIFSRFGPIKSCEVIRDAKSKESLSYAFIEFENEADCETAYFKMNNVLIDDRRIKVDFSQSVAKLKQKFGIGKFGNMVRKKWFTKIGGKKGGGRAPMVTAADFRPREQDAKYPLLIEAEDHAHHLDPHRHSDRHDKERRRSRSRSPGRQDSSHRDRDRERERDREMEREKEREKDRHREKDSGRRDRESDRERRHERSPDRERRRDRSPDRRTSSSSASRDRRPSPPPRKPSSPSRRHGAAPPSSSHHHQPGSSSSDRRDDRERRGDKGRSDSGRTDRR